MTAEDKLEDVKHSVQSLHVMKTHWLEVENGESHISHRAKVDSLEIYRPTASILKNWKLCEITFAADLFALVVAVAVVVYCHHLWPRLT